MTNPSQIMPERTIPLDVVKDIILRLPAKTLVRFKTLSKQHLSLIQSPDFIKSHLKRSIEYGNKKLVLLEAARTHSSGKLSVYSCDLDSLDSDGVKEIYCPTTNVVHVYGSCNGLLCWMNNEDFTVFNMATRELHRVPSDDRLVWEPKDLLGVMYGFGHDPINDDYKLVITRAYFKPTSSETLGYQRPATHTGCDRLIVAYDLGTEDFREIDLPDGFSHLHMCNSSIPVGVLDGGLCVMEQNFQKNSMDVWLMRHYMVKESWTKLLSVKLEDGLHHLIPLAYSKCGSKILMKSRNIVFWYDTAKARVEKLNNLPAGSLLCTETFVESLLRPY